MIIRSNRVILPFLLMLILGGTSCNHSKKSTSLQEDTQTGNTGKVDIQRLSSSLKKELGEDWKLDIRTGLQYGNLRDGFEIFGSNEALEFRPPGPKGEKYAVLHLYMHPLSIEEAPSITQAYGSILSSVVGETDHYRVYGGVIAPNSKSTIMNAVRTALNIQWGQTVKGLRCRLEKPEGTFVTDEPATITILLQNVGSEPKRVVDVAESPDGMGFGLSCLDDNCYGIDPPEGTDSGLTIILQPKQVIRRNLHLSDWTVRSNDNSVTDVPGKHTIVGFYCPAQPDRYSFHPDKVHSTPMTFYVEERK